MKFAVPPNTEKNINKRSGVSELLRNYSVICRNTLEPFKKPKSAEVLND